MCFRPAAVSLPKQCEKCGHTNKRHATVCSECGAALPESSMFAAAPGVPGAPGAPAAPAAPGAHKI
jgi:hypothetical protein